MALAVGITDSFINAAKLIAEQAINDAVDRLGPKYGFDTQEAKDFLKQGLTTVKEVPPNHLPYCGKDDNKCHGITPNSKLYTQCEQKPVEGTTWCKKCAKQVEDHGTPANGDVYQRDACEGPYKVGKGVEVLYMKFMAKKGYTKEGVIKTATKLGLTIPLKYFEEPVHKSPGRPASVNMLMGTPSIELPEPPVEDPSATAEPEMDPAVEKPKNTKKNSKPKKSKGEPEMDPEMDPVDEKPKNSKKKKSKGEPEMEPEMEPEGELEEEQVEEDDSEDEETYTFDEIDKMMVGDLRALAQSKGIPTKENGKNVAPGITKRLVFEHFNPR